MSQRKEYDISGGIDLTSGHLQTAKAITSMILGWFTITIEAFLRQDFGNDFIPGVTSMSGLWS